MDVHRHLSSSTFFYSSAFRGLRDQGSVCIYAKSYLECRPIARLSFQTHVVLLFFRQDVGSYGVLTGIQYILPLFHESGRLCVLLCFGAMVLRMMSWLGSAERQSADEADARRNKEKQSRFQYQVRSDNTPFGTFSSI